MKESERERRESLAQTPTQDHSQRPFLIRNALWLICTIADL